MLAQKSSPASTTLRLTKWSGEVVVEDKVEEGKGWSARQAPTNKTHNTHILVVSKKGSLLLQIPLHLIHNTHSCSLKSPQEDKKPCIPERGSTCYQPGRRAQTERSSSDHQSTRPQDLPAPTHRSTRPAAAHHRGLVAGATLPTRVPAGKSNRQRQ